MGTITQASEKSLRELLNYFDYYEAIFSKNNNPGISQSTIRALTRLGKILDQFEVIADTQTIIETVKDYRFLLENAIKQKVEILKNAIRQIEETINISLAKNNNVPTPYIDHLKSEKEIKIAQLNQLIQLSKNPSIFVSYILNNGGIEQYVDVNRLIEQIADSDPYIRETFSFFVGKDSQTGDRTINEPNALLGLEVLNGNYRVYNLLLEMDSYRKNITSLLNSEPLKSVTAFKDKIAKYNETYEELRKINGELNKKSLDAKYKRNTFRLKNEIMTLDIRRKQYLRLLQSLLGQINSMMLRFEDMGYTRGIVNFQDLKRMLVPEQKNVYYNGQDVLPNQEFQALCSDLRLAALKKWDEKIAKLKMMLEKCESQVPEPFLEADYISVANLIRLKHDNNGQKELSPTEVTLHSLLVISGFRKGVKINNIMLEPNEKNEIIGKAEELLNTFLDVYVKRENQTIGKQM